MPKTLVTTLTLLGTLSATTPTQAQTQTIGPNITNYYTDPELVGDFFPQLNIFVNLQADDITQLKKFADTLKKNPKALEMTQKQLLRAGQGAYHTSLRQLLEGAIGEYIYINSSTKFDNDSIHTDVYHDIYVPIIEQLYNKHQIKSPEELYNAYEIEIVQFTATDPQTKKKNNYESTRLNMRLRDFVQQVHMPNNKNIKRYGYNLMELLMKYYNNRRYISKSADIQAKDRTQRETDPLSMLQQNLPATPQTNPTQATIDYDQEIKNYIHSMNSNQVNDLRNFWVDKFFKRERSKQETFLLKYEVYVTSINAINEMNTHTKDPKKRLEAVSKLTSKLQYKTDMDDLSYYSNNKKTPLLTVIKNGIQQKLEDPNFKALEASIRAILSHLDHPTEPINIQYGLNAAADNINDATMKHIFREYLATIPLDPLKKNKLGSNDSKGAAIQDAFIIQYPQYLQTIGSPNDANIAQNNAESMLLQFMMQQTTQEHIAFHRLRYIKPSCLPEAIKYLNANPYIKQVSFNLDLLKGNYTAAEYKTFCNELAKCTKIVSVYTSGEKDEIVQELASTKGTLEYLCYKISDSERKTLLSRKGSLLMPITENVTKSAKFSEYFLNYMRANKSKPIYFSLGDYSIDEGALIAIVQGTKESKTLHTIEFAQLIISHQDMTENLRRINANLVFLSNLESGTNVILRFGDQSTKDHTKDNKDLTLNVGENLTPEQLNILANQYRGDERGSNQDTLRKDEEAILAFLAKNGNLHTLHYPELNVLPNKAQDRRLSKAGINTVKFNGDIAITRKKELKGLNKFQNVDLEGVKYISSQALKYRLQKTDHGITITSNTLDAKFFKILAKNKGKDTVDIRRVQTVGLTNGGSINFNRLIQDLSNPDLIKIMNWIKQFEDKGGKIILNPYFATIYNKRKSEQK